MFVELLQEHEAAQREKLAEDTFWFERGAALACETFELDGEKTAAANPEMFGAAAKGLRRALGVAGVGAAAGGVGGVALGRKLEAGAEEERKLEEQREALRQRILATLMAQGGASY